MAHLPCTATLHPNPRRNAGLYVHLWNGGIQFDTRHRLCPGHFTSFEHDLAKYELVSVDDASSIIATPTECFSCGEPVGQGDWHVSITAYPAKDQRKDYWSRLHVSHDTPEWMRNGEALS